jgi:membrane-bound lytic murein transglycosylase A
VIAAVVLTKLTLAATAAPVAGPGSSQLHQIDFRHLDGFTKDDHLASFVTFQQTCSAIVSQQPPLRTAIDADSAMVAVCRRALSEPVPKTRRQARRFFEDNFQAFEIVPAPAEPGRRENFVTGYYEPVLEGATAPTAQFAAPVFSLPDDLVPVSDANRPPGLDPTLTAARRNPDASLSPYPTREEIERGAIAAHCTPLVWLRDRVEVFFVHIQGSARVRLPDGRVMRLVYAGRNGQPYTSIGQSLIGNKEAAANRMSLTTLKQWIRDHGLGEGDAGTALMRRNRSYIFFRLEVDTDPQAGPVGGSGVRLTALRSIAVDRRHWAYGLPFWLSASLPWKQTRPAPFRRLMIAQDTGSAIVGAARADIFFGSGKAAGERAGGIRHPARFVVLLPNPAAASP